jgi:hypothetical protein
MEVVRHSLVRTDRSDAVNAPAKLLLSVAITPLVLGGAFILNIAALNSLTALF